MRRQTGLETSVVAAPLAELSAVDGDAAVAVEGTHEALLVGVLTLRGAPEERSAAEASDAAVTADVFLKLRHHGLSSHSVSMNVAFHE